MTPEEIKRYVGQRVQLQLTPQSGMGPSLKGRIAGTVDAADGLVLFVQPEGAAPDTRVSVHYHHVTSIAPA